MFQSAVLRLTLYYLAIIIVLSVVFSLALYKVSTAELTRIRNRQETLLRNPPDSIVLPPLEFFERFRITNIEESEHRIAFNLLYVNLIIWALGGFASYSLARKTLRPIEEAHEAQTRFTADASHELRTPLTAMKTEIEVTLRDKEVKTADLKLLLSSNLEEINKLEGLTTGLLHLAEGRAVEMKHLQALKLEDTIKTVVEQLNPIAKNKRVSIKCNLTAATVLADQQSLVTLITILLDNALKYSSADTTITIRAQTVTHTAVLEIIDQGIGINEVDLPHIFDRFYRADHSRTKDVTNTNGYGLGLSIAKKIVDEHHWTITVNSKPGKGSVFTIHLPLARPEDRPASRKKSLFTQVTDWFDGLFKGV